MKNENQVQQGDIILEKVDRLPEGCKKVKRDKRGIIFAEGEVSGHYHGCTSECVEEMISPDGKRYYLNSGNKPEAIAHQEHGNVVIAPGVWLDLNGVKEYDYFLEMERKVVD